MTVSPADFELYSRATGTPMPRTPQEQMQLAPAVHQFIQNKGYQQGGPLNNPLAAALGSAALMAGAYAASKALGGGGSDDSGAVSTDIDPKTPSPTENVGVTGSLVKNLNPTSSEIQWSSPGTTDLGLNVQVVNPLSNDGRLLVSEPFQKEERGEFNVVQPKAFGRPDVDLGFPRPLSPGMQGVGEKVRAIWQRPTFIGHEHHKNLLESVGGALATAGLDATMPEVGIPLHAVKMAGGALGNIAPAIDVGMRGLETGATVALAGLDQATGDVIDTARLLAGPGVALARKGYGDVTTYVPEYYEKYGKPVVDYAVGRAVEDTGKVVNYAKQRAADDTQLTLNFLDAYLHPEVEQGQSLLTQGNPQRDEPLIEGDQTNTSPGRGIHNPDIDDPWENEGIGLGAQVDSTPTDAVTQSWEDRGQEMPVVQTLSTDEGDQVIHKYDPDNVLDAKIRSNFVNTPYVLEQAARDHYEEEGAMTVRPQDSTSVKSFTVSPDMVFETVYGKTPDKRYGTDLSVRNTYSVDPSEVSEVANPDTFKEIERAAWKEQAERGEEVVDMMNKVAETDEGAGFLANFISKDKDKRFTDAPREETY